MKIQRDSREGTNVLPVSFLVDTERKRWYYAICSPNGALGAVFAAGGKRRNISNSSENKIKKLLTEAIRNDKISFVVTKEDSTQFFEN